MTAKTVLVIRHNSWGKKLGERRTELFDRLPDGSVGYCCLTKSDETPRPRANIAKDWKKSGDVCGPDTDQYQWWIAI